MRSSPSQAHRGFTLVELLVVVAILGILIAMLFPAVQQVRAAARRSACSSKLAQQGLALLSYEATLMSFPAGGAADTLQSWAGRILPHLDQSPLYDQIDFSLAWDAPQNLPWTEQRLDVFACPSSWKDYPGLTDYSGINGSTHNTTNNVGRNGVLFPVSKFLRPITIAEIRDGTSNTITIAEAVGLTQDNHGLWASGANCIGHEEGPINNLAGSIDEIASLHAGGANAAFADGSVRFLSDALSLDIVAALCTRDNQEVVSQF